MTTNPAEAHVLRLLDTYPDYPRAGILFRDLTSVLGDAEAFQSVIDSLVIPVRSEASADDGIVAIAGVEARGFLLAAAGAYATGRGVIAIRKAGKLPGTVLSEQYDLEYGSAELELHAGRLPAGARVLLLDDVLATGGTLGAAARLVERAGYVVGAIRVVLELDGLGGRDALAGYPVTSIATV